MIPDHHREFVARNRFCLLGWNRSEGATEGPPLTPVFCVTDGFDVLISITEDRAKTRARYGRDVFACPQPPPAAAFVAGAAR